MLTSAFAVLAISLSLPGLIHCTPAVLAKRDDVPTAAASDTPGQMQTSPPLTPTQYQTQPGPPPPQTDEHPLAGQDQDEQPVFFIPPTTPSAAASAPALPLVMAYYPDWVSSTFPPEKIDFGRIDWVDFAFALPQKDCSIGWDDPANAPAVLQRLVIIAHDAHKKVKLSVGGWTGSSYFSSCVSNDTVRNILVAEIVRQYELYSLDGIDIDWEYPGQQGAGTNGVSPADTDNFLLFLRCLRVALPDPAVITAAVQTVPFTGHDGNPIGADMGCEFAKVLDWVLIMNYDTWGSSDPPGPNAPLSDRCHNSTQPHASAAAAYKAWTSAGFAPAKIALGVPSYGYIIRSSAQVLRQRALNGTGVMERSVHPHVDIGAGELVPSSRGWRGKRAALTSDDGGQIQFRELIAQGALVGLTPSAEKSRRDASQAPVRYVGGEGYTREWDRCSSTPFLHGNGEVVSYDDPESLEMKAMFVKGLGMIGVNMFDVGGDEEGWALMDAVRAGLGR